MQRSEIPSPPLLHAPSQLEDQQSNRAGWLFAKGAFDKGDLLHLRDEEERGRHLEKEVRDAEQREFARQRAELERRAESGQGAGAAPSAGGAGAAPSKRPPGAEIPSGRCVLLRSCALHDMHVQQGEGGSQSLVSLMDP